MKFKRQVAIASECRAVYSERHFNNVVIWRRIAAVSIQAVIAIYIYSTMESIYLNDNIN